MMSAVLWRADEHEPLTERTWDDAVVERARLAIVADAESSVDENGWPGHPRDETAGVFVRSLYLGAAGMIWALDELGSSIDLGSLAARAVAGYRTSPDFGESAHAPSLWMGEAGLLVVAAKVGSSAADDARLAELVRENREHATWELMWGSPGTMLAARARGLLDAWRDSADRLWDRWEEQSDLWQQSLYGQTARILGAGHGFASNVHALRGYVSDEALRERVSRALHRTAVRRDGLVNWPPSEKPPDNFDFPIRVQWCHGAPGIVATIGDLMPLELALGAGELIWSAGPLRKGAGLCHGTAGNGYALLKLFALTGEERWLNRARRFAMHAIEQVENERKCTGRYRHTLWTGDIGVALYLQACQRRDPSFPTIDVL
jgi:hypothetical protein